MPPVCFSTGFCDEKTRRRVLATGIFDLGWKIRCRAENGVLEEMRTRELGVILLNKMIF